MKIDEFLKLVLKLRKEIEESIGIIKLLRYYGWCVVGAKSFDDCIDRVKRLGFTDIYAEYVCVASSVSRG